VNLEELKAQWNQVLDFLLERDRIAWLAFFDARLASLEEDVLTLNFSDSDKFAGKHDFAKARNPKHTALLHEAITTVFGFDLQVVEE
jgi:hypothetical protein